MAVFEKKVARKVYLDDTQILSCLFENTQNIQGHTEYIIRVQRGPLPERSWFIYKRYNDFATLHNAMQISGLNLPLPGKKLIGNLDREFIADRQAALQNYLNLILVNPILSSTLTMKRFLDPDNYATPFHELALQHVSMALRSEANYEVVKPLPEIGWRLRKHYFLIKDNSNLKVEKILSWVEHGPDKYIENRELQAIFKTLGSLEHLLIEPIDLLSCNDVGGYVVRNLVAAGSLRDLICSSKPKHPFIKKYANPKEYKTLSNVNVALFGSQILEQLKFLHEKGIPYGHLHTGNIVIENGVAKLLDIENGILGVPSFYRPYFIQHRGVQTLEAVDVYCLGHVLYEMAFGQPLHEPVCDILPPYCPPLLKSVLESILSSESCKSHLPSIADLAAHHFFASSNGSLPRHQMQSHRQLFKFPSQQREALKAACQKIEARLKEEQKVLRHQRRVARVQEQLNSEGEQRKRKIRQRRQLKEEEEQQQRLSANGKSPERSESPNSTSTATSAGTVTPPTVSSSSGMNGASPAPAPPAYDMSPAVKSPTSPPERSALLGSICNFDKGALRRSARALP